MIYPKNAGEHLGFKSFREDLMQFCSTSYAQNAFSELLPFTSYKTLSLEFSMLKEVMYLVSDHTEFPRKDITDISGVFEKIHIQGMYYTVEELHDLYRAQKNYRSVLMSVSEAETEYVNHWKVYLADYYFAEEVFQSFLSVFDEEGNVRSTASAFLKEIRDEITKARIDLRKAIQRSLEKAKEAGYVDADLEHTIINGRVVLPVRSEHKRKIKGLIHDESNTGKTTYIEPVQVIDLNNSVTELELEEKREIIRILTGLTHLLKNEETYFKGIATILGKVDWFLAKEKFARKIQGVVPQLSKEKKLKLVQAKHPILYMKNPEATVPLNVELDEENRILILSGPNAGGKSVALKTIGLLQYMFQCGIPIAAHESSELSVFKKIMVEIGDNQSIKDDLSTYSSHLTDMNYFLNNADDATLFLIDEFGSGTEPEYGSALAQNILLKLNELNAYGVVTTHFKELKNIGAKIKGLFNGAMLFDSEKLLPKFQLKTGHSGSSYAFEVAKQIGLPLEIIEGAEKLIDSDKLKYDQLLRELEKDREALHDAKKLVAQREQEIDGLAKEYRELKQYYKANKQRLLDDAKREANHLVKTANKDIERVIREIKEVEADKEKVKELRKELGKYAEPKEEVLSIIKPRKEKPLQADDWVKMEGMNGVGKVVSITKNRAEVEFNGIVLRTNVDALISANKPIVTGNKKSNTGSFVMASGLTFDPTLDIHGMRAEEVLEHFNQYMDQAIMASMKNVKIIHGKGSGVLRELIRNEAKTFKEVEKMESEHPDQGGDGVTLIYFS